MRKSSDITVVSPLPWSPATDIGNGVGGRLGEVLEDWKRISGIPRFVRWKGFDVYYPRYPFVPLVFRPFHSIVIAASTFRLMKTLVRERNIDLINAQWVFPDGVAAAWIAKRLGIPLVLTAHGCDINLYSRYRSRKPQIQWALDRSDGVITVSEALRDAVLSNYQIDRRKVVCIANGVDRQTFHPGDKDETKTRLGLDPVKRYLLFVGQLHDVKGIRYLLEAFSALKQRGKMDFETLLIGSGPLKEHVHGWVRGNGLLDRVRLLGEIPNQEIPIWMNASEVLCLPSVREGMPIVLLEAISCGLPVVASRVGGIPEVVNAGNGLLVEPGNPQALADAIEEALSRKWNRGEISRRATDFSWGRTATRYLDAFSSVLSGK